MLTALILVCSFATTPNIRDCDTFNAVDVLRVPGEFGHPAACFLHGTTFLAETAIEVGKDARVKVVCTRIHHGNVG